ncbi:MULTISPECIES: EscU/YscU/HrcU family type III secretion system export apparatus switch protein [Asaia]|uniref:Flagellar biosynthesis protein FlhB n=2 Tax=Asaia TaxID=91914 RepID=A0ABQ1M8B5_9PROT|nr:MULTISPECIES: EscU/YscU/HrcU family type III secretion system export apparatus switch protein [Asaia]GBR09900.1 flagellar biosynthetic protein FlhB [Asaia siamensis NRIC 0323]GBR11871.1 flagellar biosynthetic protein FlhB [Asaia spathodeae NBRC 105894]GGC36077.1 flagellar biosynthesis protein FlhB [Asaia siamensis]
MAEDSSSEDRTQAPTGRRLAKAREEGNVAQSRETQMLLVLGAFLAVFSLAGAASATRFVAHMHGLIEHFSTPIDDMASIGFVIRQALNEGFLLMAPLVVVSFVVVIVFSMFQTQFLFRPQALTPDITRLSPLAGFKRVFSMRNLIELLKSLAKFLIFGIVLYTIASGTLHIAPEAERWTLRRLTYEMISWFTYATLIILLVQAFIAGLDELWTRYSRLQKLRMSHQDIKDETKQEDGDPKIKAKRAQIRMRRARQRMIQSVKKATVVVTNPTHYAVALSYESSEAAAPKIVAKGADELAARIREAAQDARVPIVNSPPLARGLYALPLDTEIPPEFFKPVAAVIAYVIKLKTPRSRL